MPVRPEVIPFLFVALAFGGVVFGLARLAFRADARKAAVAGAVVAAFFGAYFLYFFRDPPRTSPDDDAAVVAGADGRVAGIVTLTPADFRKMASFCGLAGDDLESFAAGDVVRLSIFLSLFDVHVNRAPVGGSSRFLGYFPGQHVFTFKEKSSEVNQHNSILFVGQGTRCLVNQIVGPVARRVVYWPDHDRAVELPKGAPIGMMKFGSRLDMYLPAADVDMVAKVGDRVVAGVTTVARVRGKAAE